jgi:hypothetical protein
MIKFQLKGRFTLDKKYIGKDIYVAFIEDSIVKIYNHDDALSVVPENLLSTKSWVENGLYSWGKTPKHYSQVIIKI